MCEHEDWPCCGCGPDFDEHPEDHCCPDCGDPDCLGSCNYEDVWDGDDWEDDEQEQTYLDHCPDFLESDYMDEDTW